MKTADTEVDFNSYFSPDLVFLDVPWATRADVFTELEKALVAKGVVTAGYANDLIEREVKYPTGLKVPGLNVAIPHADPVHLVNPFIAFIRPLHPVPFGVMASTADDTLEASIIIVLGLSKDSLQLRALQAVIGLITKEGSAQTLQGSGDVTSILDALREEFSKPS